MIIILGGQTDCHALHMLRACHAKGYETELFDTGFFPSQHGVCWDPWSAKGKLFIDSTHYDFADISSVFWSSISQPLLGAGTHTPVNQIAMNDSCSALRTFFSETQIHWFNGWSAFDGHKVKPRQLSKAKAMGLAIPHTYIGNDVAQLLSFVDIYPRSIFKPVYGGAHTTLVENSMLNKERLQRVLKYAPVTIQEFIEGTNVRSYIIGNKVFSAQIRSDCVDFRQQVDAEHIPYQLDAVTEQTAISLCKALGMAWTAIDWRLDPQGQLHFLEANPSPMFIHFERMTGLPITDTLLAQLGLQE